MINETTKKYKRIIVDLEDQLDRQKHIAREAHEQLRTANENLRLMEKLSDMKRAANQDYKDLLESQIVWLKNLVQDLTIDPEVIETRMRVKLAVSKDMRKNEEANTRNSKFRYIQNGYSPSQDQCASAKKSY